MLSHFVFKKLLVSLTSNFFLCCPQSRKARTHFEKGGSRISGSFEGVGRGGQGVFINAAGKQGTRLYRDFHAFLKSNIICGSTSVFFFFVHFCPLLRTAYSKANYRKGQMCG